MKVIFESLPPESYLKRLWRKIVKKPRRDENVCVSCNGRTLIIKRGVVVDVPGWVPEATIYAPASARYNCFVLFEPSKP